MDMMEVQETLEVQDVQEIQEIGPPVPRKSKVSPKKLFQYHWYDDYPEWREWMQEIPNDRTKYYCAACRLTLRCGRCKILAHSKRESHVENLMKLRSRNSEYGDSTRAFDATYSTARPASGLDPFQLTSSLRFKDRLHTAEIRFATFFAEHNLPFSMAPKLLELMKLLGKEPALLRSMSVGKTKATNVINRVVYPLEIKQFEFLETRPTAGILEHQYSTPIKVLSNPANRFNTSDVRSKKRNMLADDTVNSICVIRSALKARNETACSMTITGEHLARMNSERLYGFARSTVESRTAADILRDVDAEKANDSIL